MFTPHQDYEIVRPEGERTESQEDWWQRNVSGTVSSAEVDARLEAVMSDAWRAPTEAFVCGVDSACCEEPSKLADYEEHMEERVELPTSEELSEVVKAAYMDEQAKQDMRRRVVQFRAEGLSLRAITKAYGSSHLDCSPLVSAPG